MVEKLNDARLNLLVILYNWMTKPGSTGFLEERAIPDLPASWPAVEIRALVQAATAAAWMRRDLGISIGDANLPKGIFWEFTAKGIDLVRSRASEDHLPIITTSGSFSSFCDMLLVALSDHATQQATKFDAFDLRAIAELYNLQFTADWIYLAGEVFTNRQWANITHFSDPGTEGIFSAALTGPGLLEAERLRKELLERGITPPTYPPLDGMKHVNQSLMQPDSSTLSDVGINKKLGSTDVVGFVPASDRIVRLDDNAPGRKEALENLEKIETALESGSNELKLTADERVVILSETRTLRQRLADGRVRLGALFQAIAPHGFLLLIISKLAEDAIGLAANIVLSAIKTLLQVFL